MMLLLCGLSLVVFVCYRILCGKQTACFYRGHHWKLQSADEYNMARWVCQRCPQRAGLPSQHRGVPSRWLWTFWKGETATICAIFTGRG
jgi:hypothetical protein